jgi:hypothetical protein
MVIQRLRLALSKGPKRIGVFPPHLSTEADAISETMCSLVFRILDDRKIKNSETFLAAHAVNI